MGLILKRGMCAWVQDYKNIDEGVYKLPWDMTTRGHRQWSPFWVARRSAQVSCSLACSPFMCCSHEDEVSTSV